MSGGGGGGGARPKARRRRSVPSSDERSDDGVFGGGEHAKVKVAAEEFSLLIIVRWARSEAVSLWVFVKTRVPSFWKCVTFISH